MLRGRILGPLSAIGLTLVALPALAAVPSSSPFVYVVLGAEGPVARAIVIPPSPGAAVECPAINVDGSDKQMAVRAPVDAKPGAAFPVLVCEYVLKGAPKSASIGGQSLPLPKASVSRIAVFGDTGCRLKAKGATAAEAAQDSEEEAEGTDEPPKVQDCNSQTEWPFAPMSVAIAKAKPDLVVHVGDYIYRETACPPGETKCTLTPYGDNWATWEADFFTPAAPLLQKAPWIVVRGNHEICDRAGTGYALFLDPTPAGNQIPPPCLPLINQYSVTVGDRPFIVLDSSNAPDECPDKPCKVEPWAAQFKAMKPATGTWLVTHKPIWGFTTVKVKSDKTDERKLEIRNMTLQAALAPSRKAPAGIDLVLSGHIHLWEGLSFVDGRSPQFVLGSGGTDLAHNIKQNLAGQPIDGTEVAFAKVSKEFGYTLFEPSAKGKHWNAVYYGVDGTQQFDCKLEDGTLSCK